MSLTQQGKMTKNPANVTAHAHTFTTSLNLKILSEIVCTFLCCLSLSSIAKHGKITAKQRNDTKNRLKFI